MRIRFAVRIGAAVALLLLVAQTAPAADKPNMAGKWSIGVPTVGDQPLVIIKVEPQDDQLTAEVVATQTLPFLIGAKVSEIKVTGDTLRIELKGRSGAEVFTGKLPEDAEKPILGVFRLQGNPFPARLQHTDAETVDRLTNSPVQMKILLGMRGVEDPKEKLEKLRAIVAENAGHPSLAVAYTDMVRSAQAAGLSPEEVREIASKWVSEAAAYGPEWATEAQLKLLAALGKQDKYAELKLEMAEAADKALGDDATLEQRTAVARAIAEAATAAGKEHLAGAARDRWQALETELDEQYLKTVPPFQVQPFAGRADAAHNRVVLLELFTGAQCPPCVAADVAFDALLHSYKPAELIGLQYHLHIPGPDPLTNADSLARAEYYDVHGTPSTFFNGKSEAPGGGPMAASQSKYDAYVKVIDGALAGQRGAAINLQVTRSGNIAQVEASAKVTAAPSDAAKPAAEAAPGSATKEEPKGEGADKPADDADKKPAGPQPRLRLVLVQEAIRYVGGNKLRFHHHVVRGFPGGVEGKEFTGSQSKVSLAVDLDQVRAGLEQYVQDFAAKREFSQTPPPVELKEWSVVALVQDDATKEVLDAVIVAVPDKQ